MPTYETSPEFERLHAALSTADKALFRRAVKKFIEDLKAGHQFRKSLRVRGLAGAPGMYEMTWEIQDGRAVFSYGDEVVAGERHVIWHAVGGHEIFP